MERSVGKVWAGMGGLVLLVLSGAGHGADHSGTISGKVTVGNADTIGGSGAVTIDTSGQFLVDGGNWASIANTITNNSTQSPGILVDSGQLYFNNPDTSYTHDGNGTISVTNGGVLGVISSTKTTGRSVSSIFDKTTMTRGSSSERSWAVFSNGNSTTKNYIEGDIKFARIENSGLKIMDKMTFTGEVDLLTNGDNTKIEIVSNQMDVDVTFKEEVKAHKLEIVSVDPNGKTIMQLGTTGGETVSVTARRVSLFNGGTMKVNTDATINGKLSFNAGSAIDYANSSRKLTVNGDIDTQSGTDLTFGGKVEAIDLSINGSSKATFNEDVKLSGELEVMDGNAKTLFNKAVTAGIFHTDSIPGNGDSENTFKSTLTLTGDTISENIGGKPRDLDLVVFSGKNVFEGAVDVHRTKTGAVDAQNTAIFMRSHNTFKDELEVGNGQGTVTIGHWKELTDWMNSPANPYYDSDSGDKNKFAADPDYYKQTATVVLDGKDASISAAEMYVRDNGVLQTNGDVTINVGKTYVEGNGKVVANGSITYNGNLDLLDNAQYTAGGSVNANRIYLGKDDGTGHFTGTATFNQDVVATSSIKIHGDGMSTFDKRVTVGNKANPSGGTNELEINGGTNTFNGAVTSGMLALTSFVTGNGTSSTFNDTVELWGGDRDLPDYSLLAVGGTNRFNQSVKTGNGNAVFMNTATTIANALDAGTGKITIGVDEAVIAIMEHPAERDFLRNSTAEVILSSTNSELKASSVAVTKGGTLTLRADSKIIGDAHFNDGSQLAVGAAFTDQIYGLDVSGGVKIDDGASIAVYGIDAQRAQGFAVLSTKDGIDGSFSDITSFYHLKQDENTIVTNGMKGVDEFFNEFGLTTNAGDNAAFGVITEIMGGNTDDPDLGRKLSDGMTRVGELAKKDKRQGNIAKAQLTGQHGLAGANALQATTAKFASGMQGRQGNIRAGNSSGRGGTASAGSVEGSGSAFADLRAINQGYSSFDPNRIWAGGFGAWTRQDDKNGQFGYKYNSGGVILGYDRELGDFVFGVSTAYSNGEIKNNEGYTKTDVDTFNVGLYGSYNHCSGLFVDANVGFGYAWNKTKTSDIINGNIKEGKYRNNSFQAGMKIGYDFSLPSDFHIIPSVGLDYTHVRQKGWSEKVQSTNQIANWYDKTNNDYISIPVGMRINKTFQIGGCAEITPEIRGAWIYKAKDPQSRVRMGYVGSTASATLYGIDSGRSRGLVGAGLKARVKNVDVFADYNYEFRSGYKNHNLMAGLGLSF